MDNLVRDKYYKTMSKLVEPKPTVDSEEKSSFNFYLNKSLAQIKNTYRSKKNDYIKPIYTEDDF